MLDAVPTSATVVADWPVSFLFPCYRLPSLLGGIDQAADYRIGPPRSDDFATVITYAPAHGDDGRYHPVQVTLVKREADNLARLMASLHSYVATGDDTGLQLHLYAAGTFSAAIVRLSTMPVGARPLEAW